ncbi:SagB/ThcOx family dehydrogenase [Nocardia cyriacigeorgica]|uniref:SagB/ThcOx family dehydrogenase n=1 Tax=Nocardia cyriacigeorgica TaxID=135487 RepID=A0A5R8PAI0_9NOCA|nr:SagB/ThcOx family dehydrogenase [Nocardia cyriacigeorgica]
MTRSSPSTKESDAVSAVTYPDQTRFALRDGVTCVTTASGAVLLNPPDNRKLTGLTESQLQALKQLSQGSVTLDEQTGEDAGALMSELADAGWLTVTIRDGGREQYTIRPFTRPPARPQTPPPGSWVLSKFAVLHRDREGFLLEHPMSWGDLRVHDPRLLAALDGPGATGVAREVLDRLAQDLFWGGFLVDDAAAEDREFTTRSWSAPDLWFHRRSTLGPRTITWEHFGPTKWGKGSFPQPPARKPAYPGTPVALAKPDLESLRIEDPSLTDVLEDRVSCRDYDDAAPMTIDQLGELLYRTARTRSVRQVAEGEELVSRPYPSGGSVYELELYPIVRNVAGLKPGMYHYDSFEHALRPVADADSPAVRTLVRSTSATLTDGAEPQLVLLLAARSGRVMWTYEQVAYASILKHVGVLMQTLYLAATAMGLGACAQGFSDTGAFVTAAGVDELEECSVGSVIVGTPARKR